MPPEPPADDRAAQTAWIRSLVAGIDSRTDQGRDYTLARLLHTAWPTRRGQDQ